MAIDMDLVADIRAGRVSREILLTIDNGQKRIRVWSGRGELTVDGVLYGGTSADALITIAGISDTAQLQAHEVETAINEVAAREIGINGLSARGANVSVVVIFMAGDGSIRPFRRTVFKGQVQKTSPVMSFDNFSVGHTSRPPLLDMSQSRLSRYTPEDQFFRFNSDTGLDDVPELVNKEPVEWGVTTTATGDINVNWSASGSTIKLTDTAGRNVSLQGTGAALRKIECGATDRLGTRDGTSSSTTYSWYGKAYPTAPYSSWNDVTGTGVKLYYMLGYGSTISPVNGDAAPWTGSNDHKLSGGYSAGVYDFDGVVLHSNGFVYCNGAKVVVDQGNNRIYSAGGYLIQMMQMKMVTTSPGDNQPAPAALCSDVNNKSRNDNWNFAVFKSSQYLEAQAV